MRKGRATLRTRGSRGVAPPVLAVGVCGIEAVALALPLARGLPTTLSATKAVTRAAAASAACCLFSACATEHCARSKQQ